MDIGDIARRANLNPPTFRPGEEGADEAYGIGNTIAGCKHSPQHRRVHKGWHDLPTSASRPLLRPRLVGERYLTQSTQAALLTRQQQGAHLAKPPGSIQLSRQIPPKIGTFKGQRGKSGFQFQRSNHGRILGTRVGSGRFLALDHHDIFAARPREMPRNRSTGEPTTHHDALFPMLHAPTLAPDPAGIQSQMLGHGMLIEGCVSVSVTDGEPPMPNTVGVILSGCGYMDGAEIHEAVCTLLALDRAGAKIRCYAPDVSFEVVDHRSGEPTGEKRNALAESARIARGEITDIKKANAEELDAVALPGGFGAAKVLSDFASAGPDCDVDDDVARILQEMHAAKKPILAICIAPAVIARVLGGQNPELTIGNDEGTAGAVEAMGGQHCDCAVNEFVLDKQHRIVTTPAYMIGPSIADVNKGVAKAVEALLDLIP